MPSNRANGSDLATLHRLTWRNVQTIKRVTYRTQQNQRRHFNITDSRDDVATAIGSSYINDPPREYGFDLRGLNRVVIMDGLLMRRSIYTGRRGKEAKSLRSSGVFRLGICDLSYS